MKYTCLHTHTAFCDGHDSIEAFCRAARDKGFWAIGFSAHAPLRRKTGFHSDWHLKEERLAAYLDEVREARRRWEGVLKVFLGLEVDYIHGLMGPADRDVQELGLDYLIGSVHYLIPPKGKPFTADDSAAAFAKGLAEGFGNDGEALCAAYWDAVEAMIRAGGFDILGHADLIKKNNPQDRLFSRERESYQRRTEGIAGLLAGSAIIAEVNTGGMIRYSIPEPYPSPAMLGQLKARGVPVIVTADAHRAEHLGGHYEAACNILLHAGYTCQQVLVDKGCWREDPLRPLRGIQ
ncbi:MAG: histidinol-phosphatase [Spirochaetaceae bacterium]|jgi:histidinol-phosphatase (PHP family)|nr:histidinol-phosphatase [Spirochaetaceae bacterium]